MKIKNKNCKLKKNWGKKVLIALPSQRKELQIYYHVEFIHKNKEKRYERIIL
jgi:hypothetical protein